MKIILGFEILLPRTAIGKEKAVICERGQQIESGLDLPEAREMEGLR